MNMKACKREIKKQFKSDLIQTLFKVDLQLLNIMKNYILFDNGNFNYGWPL